MYGKGEHVEMFKDKKYNISENEDLRCLERRLPKGWKKPKWTARIFVFTQLLTPSIPLPTPARKSDFLIRFHLYEHILYSFCPQ